MPSFINTVHRRYFSGIKNLCSTKQREYNENIKISSTHIKKKKQLIITYPS